MTILSSQASHTPRPFPYDGSKMRALCDAISKVLGMLSPDMEAWVRHHSRVLDVLAQPAHRIDRF